MLKRKFPNTFKKIGRRIGKKWSGWYECPDCGNGIYRQSLPMKDDVPCNVCAGKRVTANHVSSGGESMIENSTFVKFTKQVGYVKYAIFTCSCGCGAEAEKIASLSNINRILGNCVEKNPSFTGVYADNRIGNFSFVIQGKGTKMTQHGYKSEIEAAIARKQLIDDLGTDIFSLGVCPTEQQIEAFGVKEKLYMQKVRDLPVNISLSRFGTYIFSAMHDKVTTCKNFKKLADAKYYKKCYFDAKKMQAAA